MYPEEHKLNIINRKLALSLKVKRSDESEEMERTDEAVQLRFLKFPKK